MLLTTSLESATMLIGSVGGMTVSLNPLMELGKVNQIDRPSSAADEAFNDGLPIRMAAFTSYDSRVLRRRRLEAQPH
ncbi:MULTISPECIES: hypothetical protein [unclassified Synechococcus]|uniref:hypothetical protein n=2 Tax=unclassified Synechococcus TaxID=2626047 RepID=UPI0018CEDE40|nr:MULTISPECIES: hypothetical protein [unclassified Synechococcus]MEA5424348.1 hypothetical protein [Synechococcus sp. CCY9202]QPN61033.1 hypothetical protein H8F24_06940 [Synechococcus sp. CBW1002]